MNSTVTNKVQLLEISEEYAGQRVDNYLLRILKGVPKTRIYRIIRKGEVRVNKGRIKPDHRLKPGDVLRVPPIRTSGSSGGVPKRSRIDLEKRIVFEDERLIVVDKPSGLAVHGGSGLSFGLIESLRIQRPDAHYLELVHRLDRETSGCLMIAKKRSELRVLHELLRENKVTKKYLLLTSGDFSQGPFKINAPLNKNQQRGGERVVRVDPNGKEALTYFKFLEKHPGASFMEASLATGRTHQIRVHAAHTGHPLAGDNRYGNEEFNRAMKSAGLRRLFLHAHYLAFDHEETNRHIEVSAPLPEELRQVFNSL